MLGPRLVGTQYARIVALADGSGRIEVYDKLARAWGAPAADADSCGFCDLWSAPSLPLTFSLRALGENVSD